MSKVSFLPLNYAEDSRLLMQCLSELERPVFLDSSGNRNGQGRFDILSAEPAAWIQISNGYCHSSDPDIHISERSIFNSIRELQRKYILPPEDIQTTESTLPFQGGLLGYLGYPLLSGKNGLIMQDAYIGAYLWAVVVDHHQQSTTLVLPADYPTDQSQRLQHLLSEQKCTIGASDRQFRLLTEFRSQLSRIQYENAFETIKHFIRAGDCYQVNLAQEVTAKCIGDPFTAYQRLRQAMPAPFSAFIAWPEGALLSVSPERFLQKHGKSVLSQPIKGTRPRSEDPNHDQEFARELQSSEKDRAENLMIVDLIRNDLGRVCENRSIVADQLFALQSFSNVHHLVSSISGQLAPDRDALDLLMACFPGGSITGAPKLRSMEIIQQLEVTPRRAYCGTVFYLSANGDLDSSITIRSLLWEAGHLHCWAGGGIVEDSESNAEFSECFDKIALIIKTLSDES